MDSYIPEEFAHYINALRTRYWFQDSAKKFVDGTSWRVNDELCNQLPQLPYDVLISHKLDALGRIDERFLHDSDLTVFAACASYAIIKTQPFQAVRSVANRKSVNASFAVTVAYHAVPVEKLYAKRWQYLSLIQRSDAAAINQLIEFLKELTE